MSLGGDTVCGMAERPSVDFFVCSLWEGSSSIAGQELHSRGGAPCFQQDGGTIQALASGGWGVGEWGCVMMVMGEGRNYQYCCLWKSWEEVPVGLWLR